jgi:Pyruvate/2-oxoglutarate dehydrogenase complex, dehydrogenase (E1) component, eukaryotic type, beta subunit
LRVLTFAQALNEALREEMRRDESVLVLGQDVGKKGGVYLVTQGLLEEFGPERVVDTPLSESAIVGSAIGLALYGFRPVAEIQYSDFIYGGFEQIVSNLATLRYRSGGDFSAPLVIRSPVGGWIRGGMYHSQSPEAYFTHTPGLIVVCPSTPGDAKGLLKAAIRSDDPVIFFEPKRLYWTLKGEVPEGDHVEQLGRARVLRQGDDVTVVTFGAAVHEALDAARRAEERGISVEVIDLRTLKPLDLETVVGSVRKT